MTLCQLWSIICGRRTNYRFLNRSWTSEERKPMERQYVCPISGTCPQWLGLCRFNGCQHPDAIEMRREAAEARADWLKVEKAAADQYFGTERPMVRGPEAVVAWVVVAVVLLAVTVILAAVAPLIFGAIGVLRGMF